MTIKYITTALAVTAALLISASTVHAAGPLDVDCDLLSAVTDDVNDFLDGEGIRVMIGDENPLSDLARCSVVASTYGAGGQVMGSVGIVGPTRMQYSKVIPLVDYLARLISRFLSEPGH